MKAVRTHWFSTDRWDAASRPAPEFAGADAILLDDVRFAADTPHIRRETLLRLTESSALGRQIAVTADEPLPIDGATNVELGYPDLSARIEIARRIAKSRGLNLPAATIHKLAQRHPGSPRELESAITKTAAHRSLVR